MSTPSAGEFNAGSLSERDLENLRLAIAITRTSIQSGEGPFGAVMADPDGAVVMTQENTALAMRDHTKHAESLLASKFCHEYYDDPRFRAASTLYSSMEPCAMCMFTMFKAGIGRVVYGLSPTACTLLPASMAHGPERLFQATSVRGYEQPLDRPGAAS
ncbi:MAG: nucleoside deaminase [Desulfovibrio sp.]